MFKACGFVEGFKITQERNFRGEVFNKMVIGIAYPEHDEWGNEVRRVHKVNVGSEVHAVAQEFCNKCKGVEVRLPFFIGKNGDPYVYNRAFDPASGLIEFVE